MVYLIFGEIKVRGDDVSTQTGLGQLFQFQDLFLWSTRMIEKGQTTSLYEV